MDVNELAILLENEKTWKKAGFYKKQLMQGNTEIVDGLLSNLQTIIHGRNYQPMQRLGALRLLKSCLEAGSEIFNFMVQDSDILDGLIPYAKAKSNTHIFSDKPDKRELSVSITFFTYIVEGFLYWSTWFPQTKFDSIYKQLLKDGVTFPHPSKSQIFKEDIRNLYVDGEFMQQKKVDDAAHAQQANAAGGGNTNLGQTMMTKGGPGGNLTGTQIAQQNKNKVIKQHSQMEIASRITEYDSMRQLLVEMISLDDAEQQDFSMFTESFAGFSNFAEEVLEANQNMDDYMQVLIDKFEQSLEIQNIFESFFTQKLNFEQLKQHILKACHHQDNDQMQQEQQQQQQQQQQLQQQQQQQQHQREEEERRKREIEEQQQKQAHLAEIERIRQDEVRRAEEARQNELKRQHEEQQKEEQRKVEEKQKAERIQKEKEQEEERKKKAAAAAAAEEQARQKQLLEQQAKQRQQQEQEEQKRQQQLQQQQQQKLAEEEHARQLKQQQEEQREEQRKFIENHKKTQLKKSQNYIEEDQREYDDEEDRKSNLSRSKKRSFLKQNSNLSNRSATAAAAQQSTTQIHNLYNNPQMNQLKKDDATAAAASQKKSQGLVQFDQDEEDFEFDVTDNHEEQNRNHIQSNSSLKMGRPATAAAAPQQQQQSQSKVSQQDLQASYANMAIPNDPADQKNNMPYIMGSGGVGGQSAKNPFNNNQASDRSQQRHGNYFQEEEEYVAPIQTFASKSQQQHHNVHAIQQQQQPQHALRESQREDFNVSRDLDEESEERKVNNYPQIRQAGTAAANYNNPAKQISQANNASNSKKATNSRLEIADNFDDEELPTKSTSANKPGYLSGVISPKQQLSRPLANPHSNKDATLTAYPFAASGGNANANNNNNNNNNNNHSKMPSGFEQVAFEPAQQQATLKSQIQGGSVSKIPYFQQQNPRDELHNTQHSLNATNKFNQALNNTQMWEQKSQLPNDLNESRAGSQTSMTQDGKRVPLFSKDKQSVAEITHLRAQLNEVRREKDIEVNKLQVEVNAAQMRVRDLEASIAQRHSEEGHLTKAATQEKLELEKKLVEKDKQVFLMKQAHDQSVRELEQCKSLIKQHEQFKQDSHKMLIDKQVSMDEENKKTRAQLQEYIATTQKNFNSQIDSLQKSLTQAELDANRYQTETQQRELENSDLRSEIRLLKSKEQVQSSALLKEKDVKIAELRSKIDVVLQESKASEDRIRELVQENFAVKKTIEDYKDQTAAAYAQSQIYKENLTQKEIEISEVQQQNFEKDQLLRNKEASLTSVESLLEKKKQIIDQFKGSQEQQIKRFRENLEESDSMIKQLQKEKFDLENRIEHLGQQHSEEMNRIIAASRLTDQEKDMFRKLSNENERFANERDAMEAKESAYQKQIGALTASIAHLKKENHELEQNLEDQVQANNLITKRLFERDEQVSQEQILKQRETEMKEKKFHDEIKSVQQSMETLKLDKQRKENDLTRNLDTLKKENELLLNNLQVKSLLSPDRSSRSLQITKQYDNTNHDHLDLDRQSNHSGIGLVLRPTNSHNVHAHANNILPENISSLHTHPFAQTSQKQNINETNLIEEDLFSQPAGAFFQTQNSGRGTRRSQSRIQSLGVENVYNPLYFSYLSSSGDNSKSQMYRFRKSCLKSKMAIFQDNFVNVSVMTESKEIDSKTYLLISLSFENKSLSLPLTNVNITYDGDLSINVYKKPNVMPTEFAETSQHQQQIITDFNEMPFRVISCTFKYTANGVNYSAVFPIPNAVIKYFITQPDLTQLSFDQAYRTYNHTSQASEEIHVDKNIASSQYDYQNYFPEFINLGALEGFNDYQSIGGHYFMKNIDTNIWLKINYNKREHKAIFQAVYDNHLEEYSTNMVKYLLQTLMMIFKE